MLELEQIEIQAINRSLNKAVLSDDSIVDIAGWHNADENNVDPEDATFITLQLPNGKWTWAMLMDFDGMAS